MIAFGPVPSRRLGFSLGINHIPPKCCSYACVYCQVGRTSSLMIEPRTFYTVDEVVSAVQQKVYDCAQTGQKIDYLTFVPDGEPALDQNLAEEIRSLRRFSIPIAVISNATLLTNTTVVEALKLADWVSLKVDSVNENIWRKINRPHGHLRLEKILEAMLRFSGDYRGKLVTETMLVKNLNDSHTELEEIAAFLETLSPDTACLSSPIRPPAEKWVLPPNPQTINSAYQIFSARLPKVELITTPEKNSFPLTSQLENDLLSITSVHPLREDAVRRLVEQSGGSWCQVEELITAGDLLRLEYQGDTFYLRNFNAPPSN